MDFSQFGHCREFPAWWTTPHRAMPCLAPWKIIWEKTWENHMEIIWKSHGNHIGNHGFITSKARTEKPLGKPQGLAPACWASGRTSTTWTQPELRNTQDPMNGRDFGPHQVSHAGMPRMAAKGVPMAATTCFNIPSCSNCKVGCKLLAASSSRA